MTTMSPYDAHASNVGPVFDVGRWSGARCIKMGIIFGVVGISALLVTVFLYDPTLLLGHPKKEPLKGLVEETLDTHKEHPWGMRAGMAGVGLVGWFCTAAAIAIFRDVNGDYFLRVGPEGVSLRLPNGLDFSQAGFGSIIESLDIPWSEIENLRVTSDKQLGSLSRNAGNIGSSVSLKLVSGKKYNFDTSMLSLPGYLIHQRIEEAREMEIADLGFDPAADEVPATVEPTHFV